MQIGKGEVQLKIAQQMIFRPMAARFEVLARAFFLYKTVSIFFSHAI